MAATDPPAPAWRLLVVDDDVDFAESLATLLGLEGHEVRLAHGAAEACDLIADWTPDVALVDIRLGRDDGVALVGDIHQLRPETVVVMMTAYASLETAVGALKAGAYDFLIKPFFSYDLDRTLGRCFERLRLVAERDAAEDRLRRAQRLDALGQLGGGVAHEFNNTLAVILGNLQLLDERLHDQPMLREMVEDALGAVHGGMELTSRLLSQARGAPLHAEPTDLAEALPATCRLLERTLGSGIAVVLDLRPDLPPVLVDRSQLEASLINLSINARDAMADGGRLIMAARSGDGFVELAISDTGPGMPPDLLARATEPFFTTKPAGRGLGLGLAMVAAFAERSGGALGLDSPPGRGLTATLHLPIAATGLGPAAMPRSDAPVPSDRSEGILLVEDDPDVLRTLRRQLEHLGYRVGVATRAEDAIAAVGDPSINLLMTDVGLAGGRSGFDLVQDAARLRPDIGLILLTADAGPTRRSPLPGMAFLIKPVDLGTLARAVRAALQGRAAGSGAKT
jgi:signal transduction histidine kinase